MYAYIAIEPWIERNESLAFSKIAHRMSDGKNAINQ